ncbi:MAG: glycoside hydrolase/phage tail family protein [Pseudomonadota bacterium]
MATIVLQAVGSAVGAAVGGPLGAAIGQAIGAAAGSAIDQQLFGPGDQTVSGPRLDTARVLSSREGNPVARVYGRHRVAGDVIWATQLEEVRSSESRSSGGKASGPKTTVNTYTYFANFAVGLCEGRIGGIGDIWVDGTLLDQTQHTLRLHTGRNDQLPDALIEAKQGEGNAPAYRGLAYLVFENFAVEDFGNRIPQIAVEIIRPLNGVESTIRGVNLIPGASEFAYDPQPVIEQVDDGETRPLNIHQLQAESDLLASLDQLQASCPNLQQVTLVVSWFGDDLRAGHCTVAPRVETPLRNLQSGQPWSVAGLSRGQARLVSQKDGRPVYGGTPSDGGVLRAIAEIKRRGLRVGLNPFLLMDIPEENTLPGLNDETSQPANPWRGRISAVYSDPGRPTSVAVDVAANVSAFAGQTPVNAVTVSNNKVQHQGADDWCYRRMVLHFARLAEIAGGVDLFLLGSELRGLTGSGSATNGFPFVDALATLAADIRPLLGDGCTLTYGADWTEYFGLQTGNGDLVYNLDPLWASANIDAVGIDAYFPMSDWREDADHQSNGRAQHDGDHLYQSLASGEGFDWYYANAEDRANGLRTSISDGLGKPWVYRVKDLRSWWENQHFDRADGVEAITASAWIPRSKPIVFTEYGAPAVDQGAGQPNVFFDANSSESRLPHRSHGGRDDQIQRSLLHAYARRFDVSHPMSSAADNPLSPLYDAPMVDMAQAQVWAWDARPYPAFPERSDVWSDASNWWRGHWLNGRIGGLALSDLIQQLCLEAGISDASTEHVYGTVDGFALGSNSSARQTLEALLTLYDIAVLETDARLVFRSVGTDSIRTVGNNDPVQRADEPLLQLERSQRSDIPSSLDVQHADQVRAYQTTKTSVRRINDLSDTKQVIDLPLAVHPSVVESVAEARLKSIWAQSQTATFHLPMRFADLAVGDVVSIDTQTSGTLQNDVLWRLDSIETSDALKIGASVFDPPKPTPVLAPDTAQSLLKDVSSGKPLPVFLDLPTLPQTQGTSGNWVAIASTPWQGPYAVLASATQSDFTNRTLCETPATIGTLVSDLAPARASGRWWRGASLRLKARRASFSSAEMEQVLSGTNALAVQTQSGTWEVVQFATANLVEHGVWALSDLLRGQAGTEAQATLGALAGARVVVLDTNIKPLSTAVAPRGLALNWLVGSNGKSVSKETYASNSFTPGYRSLVPLSPAHLASRFDADGTGSAILQLRWIRRDRIDADDWLVSEIPMSEASERYAITLAANGMTTSFETQAPFLALMVSELAELSLASGDVLTVSVSQIAQGVGPGDPTVISIVYP